ncbi:DUF1800 domain-containing protein [Roseateles sp. PN1]|uniref:DUF1800 domain-containing protein n=1 Tax=Roseateles sp. PN1 TaxID=3137372 RepID=UPI0031399EBA
MLNRRQGLQALAGMSLLPSLALRVEGSMGAKFTNPAVPLAGQAHAGQQGALHALNRLGFGPTAVDVSAIASQGPQAWLQDFLTQQLGGSALSLPPALQGQLAAMPTLQLSQAELLGRFRQAAKAGREAKRQAAAPGAGEQANKAEPAEAQNARREFVRPVVLEASSQRIWRALQSPAQLEEVLVDFWFNHFNVFVGKGPVSVLVGSYEREAIRPHVLGNFRQMLGAVAKHPAMLIYLDNVLSVAPGYRPPARALQSAPGATPAAARPTGLNENYARELMELHTLGVDGGYSQRDVTELARIFTGWTVNYRRAMNGGGSASDADLFEFDPRRHDGGSKQLLGRSVPPAGRAEGEMALDVLAAHPATARHIAFKLAQAFVADAPPPALVQRLQARFLESRGDLRALMRSLVEAEEFWHAASIGAKFKTPYQYLLSSLRALGVNAPEVGPLLGWLAQAGMPLYGAQTPDGYKAVAAAWMNADALAQRVQLAGNLAKRLSRSGDAAGLAAHGGLFAQLSAGTRTAIAKEPVAMQVALALGSPDFMRC